MTYQTRKHLTVWLGLIAMWLVVLAPLASQLVVSARSDDPTVAALCSATQPAADSAHLAHGEPLTACGYCDLLADHVAIPALPAFPLVYVTLLLIVATPVLSTCFAPPGTFPAKRPRAPPAFPQLSL